MVLEENIEIGEKYIFDLEGVSHKYPLTNIVELIDIIEMPDRLIVECVNTDELITVTHQVLTTIERAKDIYKGYVKSPSPHPMTEEYHFYEWKINKMEDALLDVGEISYLTEVTSVPEIDELKER